MFSRLKASLMMLLFAFVAPSALAYVGPPTLTPASPIAGQTVTLNVPSGVCDLIGTSNSFPNDGVPQITIEGNSITALFYTLHADDPEFCFYPENVTQLVVGSFAAGTYAVEVDQWSDFFNPPVRVVGKLSMIVAGAPIPIQAPALGMFAEFGIAVFLLVLGCLSLRRQRSAVLLMIAALSGLGAKGATAQTPPPPQTIEVLLSVAPGAPTADDIVSYFGQRPLAATAPLSSLTVQNPVSAAYLMPLRATGDLLALLNANPTSSPAMLERYLVVMYPAGANLQTALTALQADPYVQAAYLSKKRRFIIGWPAVFRGR